MDEPPRQPARFTLTGILIAAFLVMAFSLMGLGAHHLWRLLHDV